MRGRAMKVRAGGWSRAWEQSPSLGAETAPPASEPRLRRGGQADVGGRVRGRERKVSVTVRAMRPTVSDAGDSHPTRWAQDSEPLLGARCVVRAAGAGGHWQVRQEPWEGPASPCIRESPCL